MNWLVYQAKWLKWFYDGPNIVLMQMQGCGWREIRKAVEEWRAKEPKWIVS